MAQHASSQPTEVELQRLRILWDDGEAAFSDAVHRCFGVGDARHQVLMGAAGGSSSGARRSVAAVQWKPVQWKAEAMAAISTRLRFCRRLARRFLPHQRFVDWLGYLRSFVLRKSEKDRNALFFSSSFSISSSDISPSCFSSIR